MEEARRHWLEHIGEVAAALEPDSNQPPSPLTFVLGAGASLSSKGPKTADILARCKHQRPNVFPSDDAVYEKFSTALTARERDTIIRPLFDEMEPYVGYRCLAAMAQSRPIFVVNLNWDSCVKDACERVDVPVSSFDLVDVGAGRKAIAEAVERGFGVVCAHVHGCLADDPKGARRGIRFARPDTHAFQPDELQLLQEVLAHFTIVVGTSLVGTRDTHEMLQALLPRTAGDLAERAVAEPLWVFERGKPSRAPGFSSEIAVGLSNALLARQSIYNFISTTDVDFDALLTELRAEESGLCWKDVAAPKTRLAPSNEMVPPDPDCGRPLLDAGDILLVGAPHVGSSTLAYRLAWWQCLTEVQGPGEARKVKGFQGAGQALEYLLNGDLERDRVGSIVIDDLFDEEGDGGEAEKSLYERLAQEIRAIRGARVVATASPDATIASVCAADAPMRGVLEGTPVWARSLWRPADLRAWARARGGDRAEMVCREVRMGLISTPSQAVRTYYGYVPHEQDPSWSARLRKHLEETYLFGSPTALALAVLRLQDFSVPRPERLLNEIAGNGSTDAVTGDPWGLCHPIEVDGERYLRLGDPGVVQLVDDWLAVGRPTLEEQLRERGEAARWALDAFDHWDAFREVDDSLELPKHFNNHELELFGSEYVRRALQKKAPDLAVDALRHIWNAARDHWTAKDVALDLVLNWERMKTYSCARELRDDLLEANDELGAYALFEAIMRVGRPVSLELWTAVVSQLLDLAAKTGTDLMARRQIALSYDALLWRSAPVSLEQEHKLLHLLREAARTDERLYALLAGACAYHHQGAERLRKAGYDLPLLDGTDVTLEQAREMAWLVAWHFAHQSRCRAVASRRTFLSTIDAFVEAGAPRYLDRCCRQDPLDAEHHAAVVRLVSALLGHTETAGWGLHLIMNIHATTGAFTVSEAHIARLNDLIEKETKPGTAIVAAALTYTPSDQVQELLSGHLSSKAGIDALQEGLGRGLPIEGTHVAEPRFSMGVDPWETRDRWGATPRNLPLGASGPLELIEKLTETIEFAVEAELVEWEAAERAVSIMRRGHMQAAELWRAKRSEGYLQLLVFVTEYYKKSGDGLQ